jgi:hypothetical protein
MKAISDIRTATVAGLFALLMAACGRERSPEEQIRDVVAAAEKGAEARDLSEVMALVSDRYSDLQEQDKAAVREVMRGYFLVNQSIHLLTRVEDIRLESDELATAHATVGMLGREDGDWALAADVYEFDLRFLREDGTWRVQSATWRRARD